jgi:CRISPR/Cas system-associated exonuclease Cas4 (RecB family)
VQLPDRTGSHTPERQTNAELHAGLGSLPYSQVAPFTEQRAPEAGADAGHTGLGAAPARIDRSGRAAGRGGIRATDYKTGKARAKDGVTVIGGGETLQPVLYALVLEKLFPGVKVDGGRLYYLTSSGDFKDVFIRLDDEARDGARLVGETIGQALAEGFLPAAPIKGGCEYCDYKVVCGPYEEMRTKRRNQAKLKALVELRSRR